MSVANKVITEKYCYTYFLPLSNILHVTIVHSSHIIYDIRRRRVIKLACSATICLGFKEKVKNPRQKVIL